MSELSMYEAQIKKMQGLCDEHELIYRFKKDNYPITFSIKPSQSVNAQLSMLEDADEVNYRSPDSSMTWIFIDGVLETKVQGGIFTISKTLRTKIEAILVKMIAYWQQYFFRDVIEKHALRVGMAPIISDGDSNAPDSEDSWDDENLEEAETSSDEQYIQEAARIVRAENAATTSILQRRMGIGYSRAASLISILEERGVVSPARGYKPREVLPYDEPDDVEPDREGQV